MIIKRLKNATSLRRFYSDFAAQPRERRSRVIFRGHADAGWGLQTTLDRVQRFADDTERAGYFDALIREFRREAFRVVPNPTALPDGIPFELLARHHGVPSPFLDWTESPYIAAYFAFEGGLTAGARDVAIWSFDRLKYLPADDEIELIDDPELIRYNRRALQQRGQFMRVRTISRTVEDFLADALTKVVASTSMGGEVVADLDVMGINAATLFADLDGAAEAAKIRLAL